MSDMYQRLKAAIPDATFHPPASEAQINRVERALGVQFPEWLRELYLYCNGISGKQYGEPYLLPLESSSSDDDSSSLLAWNRFHRSLSDDSREHYEDGRIEQWEKLHARNFLLVGHTATAQEWAIRLGAGPEILWYDVRNPGDYEILGEDLVEVVLNHERESRDIHNQIFRGREPIRREDDMPPSTDIELLFDSLIEFYRATKGIPMFARQATSPGWHLYRATSQRPGERGELFILHRGQMEFQIATNDGNLFFLMRAKVPVQSEPLQCLVKDLPSALLCILFVMDVLSDKALETPARQVRLSQRAAEVWRHRYGPVEPELEAMADTLFSRDDRRLEEENRLGS